MNSVWDLAVSSASGSSGSSSSGSPATATSSRALHVELTSQQRRLRHLRSIAARNIVNRNDSPLLDTFFTLHLCVGDRISRDFYKSEVIRDSLHHANRWGYCFHDLTLLDGHVGETDLLHGGLQASPSACTHNASVLFQFLKQPVESGFIFHLRRGQK
ncbi:hypothetical protein NFI96_030372 [Prochilodus magdalenae]|nr:hypothetical protein NFI96_030372 [Prochilodus magdalenae]